MTCRRIPLLTMAGRLLLSFGGPWGSPNNRPARRGNSCHINGRSLHGISPPNIPAAGSKNWNLRAFASAICPPEVLSRCRTAAGLRHGLRK
jgi:hypothetical protein